MNIVCCIILFSFYIDFFLALFHPLCRKKINLGLCLQKKIDSNSFLDYEFDTHWITCKNSRSYFFLSFVWMTSGEVTLTKCKLEN
uniref:Putative secreted protein n=1 Tax=Panstrongylus lignarius TaxID=156445 RepID=A0A224XS99_9HEMI